MPPAPKHPGARARRNKSATAATLQVREPSEINVPTPPEHPDECEWHPQAVQMWNGLWASPMAPEYDSSDVHGMFVLLLLYDAFYKTTSATLRAKLAAEIRLTGQRFGTSPLDRRRLEWQIEQSEDAKARGQRRSAQETPIAPRTGSQDPRGALRAIK
jgi:hypothetical protein